MHRTGLVSITVVVLLVQNAGLPRNVHGQLLQIVRQADVKERFAGLGLEPRGTSPQEYAAFIKSEIDKVARIARAIGLQPE